MLRTDHLISPILSLDSKLVAGNDHHFNVYFHQYSGPVDVGKGSRFPQVINSHLPSHNLLAHARQQLSKISNSVNLQFTEVADRSIADIAIYFDSEINLDQDDSVTFGVVITNATANPRRHWFEVFLNTPALSETSHDFQAYVFNHEILHALGLEHTFDDSDGDFYLSTDPQLSATPEETVMSYRLPDSGTYPDDLSSADYLALQQIWGVNPHPGISSYPEVAVYRLYNPKLDSHIYSAVQEEIDILTGVTSNGSSYLNEGIAYIVGSNPNQNVFRFYNSTSNRHFYSASDFEKDLIISTSSSSMLYEGIAFKVFSYSSSEDKLPVFRFFDPTLNIHLYSASPQEISIWETSNHQWINEGIAWFLIPLSRLVFRAVVPNFRYLHHFDFSRLLEFLFYIQKIIASWL